MAVSPGSQTSEFSLTKLVIFFGITLDVVALVLESLGQVGLNFGWTPAVLVVVGTLSALVAKLGYTRSRTLLKLQTQVPQLAGEVAGTLPLAKDVVQTVRLLVREELAKRQTPPSAP